MSNLSLQENNLESPMARSVVGETKEESKQSELVKGAGSMTSIASSLPQTNTQNDVSSIAVCPPSNKKRICNDKSRTSKKSTQTMRLSKKSQAGSTSNERHSNPYWTPVSKEWCRKLWLPTETGYVGSHLNTSSGCLNVVESLSSSKVKRNLALNPSLQMTSSKSSTFSLADTTERGGIILHAEQKKNYKKKLQKNFDLYTAKLKKQGVERDRVLLDVPDDAKTMIRAKTIQVLPTSKQKRILNDWFASFRKVWNCTVHDLNHHLRQDNTYRPSEVHLRDKFVIAKRMSSSVKKQLGWTLRTPKRIREAAVKDVVASFKSASTQKRKRKIKKFKIRDKSRLEKRQTILISSDSTYIRNGDLFTNGMSLRLRETMGDCSLEHNMRLTRVDGLYYINIPISSSPILVTKASPDDRIVSVDPGENIFGTYYSPDGEWGELGADLKSRLETFYRKQDDIEKSTMTDTKKQRALKKVAKRILGMMDDFHWKVCYWFLDHFQVIVIPRLYVPRGNTLRKKFASDLRHCTFVDRLVHVSRLYPNARIHETSERNTSKSCTRCLSMNTARSAGRVTCRKCTFVSHRDLNGARNIFLTPLR